MGEKAQRSIGMASTSMGKQDSATQLGEPFRFVQRACRSHGHSLGTMPLLREWESYDKGDRSHLGAGRLGWGVVQVSELPFWRWTPVFITCFISTCFCRTLCLPLLAFLLPWRGVSGLNRWGDWQRPGSPLPTGHLTSCSQLPSLYPISTLLRHLFAATADPAARDIA